MKFYVIEISEGDSKIKGKSIYEYATLDEAIATYHSKMASAMRSELFTSEQILVINSDNGVHISDKFVKPVNDMVEDTTI